MKMVPVAMLVLLTAACGPVYDDDSRYVRGSDGYYRAGSAVGGQGEVLVCHKGKKTLSLPASAVDAHLGHGDRRGAC
jgi:hypothetical protein